MAKAEKEPTDHWMNAEEAPGAGNIYGGPIKLPDGRLANIYLVMGEKDIAILEAKIAYFNVPGGSTLQRTEIAETNIALTEEELSQMVMLGDREVTLRRYIFESIIPYYYKRKKKP